MAKRDIFGELVEGVAAMKSHREGKLTLRSYKVEVAPLPKVDSKLIRDTRKSVIILYTPTQGCCNQRGMVQDILG